jgi:hypothetical protein
LHSTEDFVLTTIKILLIKQAAHQITLMVLSLVMAKILLFSLQQMKRQLTKKKKKKKTYHGKCKIQTPRPATAMIGNVR